MTGRCSRPRPRQSSTTGGVDDVSVPSFGSRMVCTGCGIVGAGAPTKLDRSTVETEPNRDALPLAELAQNGFWVKGRI
jgi:hypothetical protein